MIAVLAIGLLFGMVFAGWVALLPQRAGHGRGAPSGEVRCPPPYDWSQDRGFDPVPGDADEFFRWLEEHGQ